MTTTATDTKEMKKIDMSLFNCF